jgi:hypothetical protein
MHREGAESAKISLCVLRDFAVRSFYREKEE